RGKEGVPKAIKVRAYVATVFLTLGLGGVAYKAWALQVDDAAEFRARALRQHVHTGELPAPRGATGGARGRPLAVPRRVAAAPAGLELRFDKELTGQRAQIAGIRDAHGNTALADGIVDATPGDTVQLTIDSAIQAMCDDALEEDVTKNQAKAGIVVVEDVATG